MEITLYTLTSIIHDVNKIDRDSETFLKNIEKESGCKFNIKGEDFSGYDDSALNFIYVRTGGTENIFRQNAGKISGKVILLTSGHDNSLAASMEILSYLRMQGRKGEIIHGSIPYIAGKTRLYAEIHQARKNLKGKKIGIIGKPSDWLISSRYDTEAIKEKLGIEIVDIPVSELTDTYHACSLRQETFPEKMDYHFKRYAPKMLGEYKEGAFRIYLSLEKLIRKYDLSGFTLRCFDLLSAIGNTGCLALAMLNAGGIPACCEGDVPALLTMMIGNALTGVSGFQANPSEIDPETGRLTFAHCTVPLNMVERFRYDTHFESGIGVAIKGELPKGPVTIAKVSGDLTKFRFIDAELTANLSEINLCRTQITIDAPGAEDYFLNEPIGNHHVIFPEHHARKFAGFMKTLEE